MQSSADGWSHAAVGLGEVAGWRRDLRVVDNLQVK